DRLVAGVPALLEVVAHPDRGEGVAAEVGGALPRVHEGSAGCIVCVTGEPVEAEGHGHAPEDMRAVSEARSTLRISLGSLRSPGEVLVSRMVGPGRRLGPGLHRPGHAPAEGHPRGLAGLRARWLSPARADDIMSSDSLSCVH